MESQQASVERLINLKKINVKNPLKIPPLPIWFPYTKSVKPEEGSKRDAMKMMERFNENVSVGVGLPASSSTSLVRFTGISNNMLRLYALDLSNVPILHRNILKEEENGMFACNIPDISDLALHPKTAKIWFYWMLVNANEDQLPVLMSMLMAETSPELPIRMEACLLPFGESSVCVRSYSNYFKAVDINTRTMMKVDITTRTRDTTSDPRDGRTTELIMHGHMKDLQLVDEEISTDTHISILIWNCRGMAHDGFSTVLDHLVEVHWPDLVLLLETRVGDSICEGIVRNFRFRSIKIASPPSGLAGGVALLGKGKTPKIIARGSSDNGTSKWTVMCDD